MARINLLPWRAERRRQLQRQFLMMLGAGAVAAVLVWLGALSYIGHLIESQKARNTFLTAQTALLDKKIAEIEELEKERERLIARMRAIETLQTSRPVVVHLFDELVRTLPEGVSLTELSQKDQLITVKGSASSNARVSNFMRNIENSQWITNPRLLVIENKSSGDDKVATFTLTFEQKKQKTEADEPAPTKSKKPATGTAS